MWGDQETGTMEYYSESYTEPKLIDFFKSEMPLREDYVEDHGVVAEQTYVYRTGNQQLGSKGNGASQELLAVADSGRSLKLEPPSGIFVDFLSRNGDDPNHQLAVSRSSSDEGKHPMAPKSILEAGTGDQWSLITSRPNLPNLALKLLSPSPTGTQGSGTSPPKTPTFDMELNSRARAQPCVTRIPDHEGESSTLSADSDRRLVGSSRADAADRNSRVQEKGQFSGTAGSRVYRWSPKNGQKRLKLRTQSDGIDDGDDDAAMVERSNVESRTQTCRKLEEKDDEEEKEAAVQAAASLLSLSSNEDDWQRTSSVKSPIRRRNVSSSSSLPAIGEGSEQETEAPVHRLNASSSSSLAIIGGSERENGEVGSFVGCSSGSSVLSRPSNKRRYRLVVDLLAESSRVR